MYDLRPVHSLFQREFFIPCDTQCFRFQLPVSYNFLNVIQYLLTSSSSSSRHVDPSFSLSFHNVIQKAVPTQDVTNPVSVPSLCCILAISFFLDSHVISMESVMWKPKLVYHLKIFQFNHYDVLLNLTYIVEGDVIMEINDVAFYYKTFPVAAGEWILLRVVCVFIVLSLIHSSCLLI